MTPVDASAVAELVENVCDAYSSLARGTVTNGYAYQYKSELLSLLEQQSAEIVEQKGYAQKYVNECVVLNGKLAAQAACLQELERDAARYRWLREHGYAKRITYGYTSVGLDSVIDMALAADAGKP
jgi:hypothetical protein